MAKRKSKRWTQTAIKASKAGKKKSKGNTGRPMCPICKTAHWSNEPHHFAPKASVVQLDDIRVRR